MKKTPPSPVKTCATLPSALANFDSLPASGFVRQPVVEQLFACSPATIWRMVKRGDLPAPSKLSPRVTAWNVGKLRNVLSQRGVA